MLAFNEGDAGVAPEQIQLGGIFSFYEPDCCGQEIWRKLWGSELKQCNCSQIFNQIFNQVFSQHKKGAQLQLRPT